MSEVPQDGFCPVCGALEEDFCCTPNGSPREDHKRRHPLPDVES